MTRVRQGGRPKTNNAYDIICLSPHLDDAVLSCGGSLYVKAAAGARILVFTVAAAGPPPAGPLSPLAQRFLEACGLARDGGLQRQAEDLEACQMLGIEHRHGGLQDALYRANPDTGVPFYPTQARIFGPVAPEERGLLDELILQFRALPAAREIYAPLGVGGHADHLLVQLAAARCFGPLVRYYEDFPYARKRFAVHHCVRPLRAWRSQVFPLDTLALNAKVRAIAAYTSQIPVLFGDHDRMVLQVRRYVRRAGGERFWEARAFKDQTC